MALQQGGILFPHLVGRDYVDFHFLMEHGQDGAVPSDLDGILERHGQFLILDRKKSTGIIRNGQRRLYEALAALPQFEVWVVVIDAVDRVSEATRIIQGGERTLARNHREFIKCYKAWWEAADTEADSRTSPPLER